MIKTLEKPFKWPISIEWVLSFKVLHNQFVVSLYKWALTHNWSSTSYTWQHNSKYQMSRGVQVWRLSLAEYSLIYDSKRGQNLSEILEGPRVGTDRDRLVATALWAKG